MERGKIPLTVRLGLDLAMALLLAVCLGARLTEGAAHEWMGMLFFALAGLHVWIHRRWAGTLFRGRYTLARAVNLAVNLALAGLLLLIAWAGLMNSRFVLGFLELEGGMRYREIHTAAYWLLVCSGVHAGLHWPIIAGWFRKIIARGLGGVGRAWTRGLWGLAVLAGVWASFDREMGAKLFLGYGFDYWDPERPAALFYGSVLSILALYALAARLVMRGVEKVLPYNVVWRYQLSAGQVEHSETMRPEAK